MVVERSDAIVEKLITKFWWGMKKLKIWEEERR